MEKDWTIKTTFNCICPAPHSNILEWGKKARFIEQVN